MSMGVDHKAFNRDLQTVVKAIEDMGKKVNARDIGKMQSKALVVTRDAMRNNIEDLPSGEVFKVYKKGGLYAEISPGVLRKSIGIMSSRVSNGKLFSSKFVGPKVKGAFKDPERGGWFGHFVNYGYLNTGSGLYSGQNKGFADRAKASTYGKVVITFRKEANAYINKLRQTSGL